MGITSLLILKSLELIKRKYADQPERPVLSKIIWLLGTARNAFVVIIAASVAYAVEKENIEYWKDGCKGRLIIYLRHYM